MLILDDIDDRKVMILRVSPVTMPRYLAYRTIADAVVAMITLAVTVPISGLGLASPFSACSPLWCWPPHRHP